MIRQCFADLQREPPVLVDWLPWNDTFGGNHNVGITVCNGGTLYIDEGKPTPALIGETLRNLREIAPTMYFNVAKGFEEIANALDLDPVLRETAVQPRQDVLLLGRRPLAAGLGQARPRRRSARRRARAHARRPRHDRDRAVRGLCECARPEVGPHRAAGVRYRAEGRARWRSETGRQARDALPRSERHARLLARAACRAFVGAAPQAPAEHAMRAFLQTMVDRLHASGTGSAARVARSCSSNRPRSTEAKSPTKARSTRARC